MKNKQKMHQGLSRISMMHYFKLFFRSCLFLVAVVVYCADWGQGSENLFAAAKKTPVILPLVFIPSIYTWSLLGVAIALLVRWEIAVYRHPERFSESTNACLSCAGCQEKLCSHKKQLRRYLKKKRYKTIPVSVAQQQL